MTKKTTDKQSTDKQADKKIDVLEGQECPICGEKKLTLTESEDDIPYFGKVYLFSMQCSGCKFHKADLESAEEREPVKYTIEVSGEADMKIRIVKASTATVKIPHVVTIESGEGSVGYISNIEGLLSRVKHQIESAMEAEEDEALKKKAKNLLKKLRRVEWGDEKLKIIIEDKTGNSAIISEKAEKAKLK